MTTSEVRLLPVRDLPEIVPGTDLAYEIVAAMERGGTPIAGGDVLVVTHKIVAKAEGALVDLRTITPSPFAEQYAARWGKDPRHIEVVLRQSARIVRMDHGVLISETRHGFICANAGVDASNMMGEDTVCVLPVEPDASARRIVEGVQALTGQTVAVIVCDTFGRAWREGLTNIAIGVAGLRPLHSYVGMPDAQGRELRVSVMAVADELASAAELVMGKLDRVPAALIRGYGYEAGSGSARELLRRPELDLFR
jgi:coenzyme F420-0:L-glutamate ligase/coenzyme F420-1:gamma-L-glutamate ligase